MGRIIEGLWDCPYCDTKGIRGRERVCPVCSKERGEHTKFYMGNPDDYVVPETEAKKISKEPDWLCSYCDSYNVATSKKCYNCGHIKDEGDIDYFKKHQNDEDKKKQLNITSENKYNSSIKNGTTTRTTGYLGNNQTGYPHNSTRKSSIDDLDNRVSQHIKKSYNQPTKKNHKKAGGFLKFGGIGLALFAFVWLMCFLFIPKEAEMTITDVAWEYNLQIEEYRTVDESGWSLPSGARLHYSQSEIHHYQDILDHYETKTRTYTEQVLDHYETVVTGHRDMGNGYFEEITSQRPVYRTETKTETYQEPVYRSEPVFQTKYYYEIDKWMYDRTIKSSGHDKNTYYGEYTLAEKEREGSRSQDYEFTGKTEDDVYTFDVSKIEWDKYDVGDTITVKINNLNMVSIVEDN